MPMLLHADEDAYAGTDVDTDAYADGETGVGVDADDDVAS